MLKLNILQSKLVPGDKDGVGGIYNFVTKRCLEVKIQKYLGHKLNWFNITWKYPLYFARRQFNRILLYCDY